MRIRIKIYETGDEIWIELHELISPNEVIRELYENNIINKAPLKDYYMKFLNSSKILKNDPYEFDSLSRSGEEEVFLVTYYQQDKNPERISTENKNSKYEDSDRIHTIWQRTGTFVLGSGLIIAGVVDAAVDPFGFANAPQFFAAGASLISISIFGKSSKK